MLVLTRRESEKIVVPGLGITLQVLSIKGNSVRLGIEAPQEIRILRGEVLPRDSAQPDEPTRSDKSDDQTSAPNREGQSQPLLAYLRKSQIEAVPNSIGFPASEPRSSVREQGPAYEVCT